MCPHYIIGQVVVAEDHILAFLSCTSRPLRQDEKSLQDMQLRKVSVAAIEPANGRSASDRIGVQNQNIGAHGILAYQATLLKGAK